MLLRDLESARGPPHAYLHRRSSFGLLTHAARVISGSPTWVRTDARRSTWSLSEASVVLIADGVRVRAASTTRRCPTPPGAVAPFFDYAHNSLGESIIGGYVYRGTAEPGLDGSYFFGDFVSGRIFSLRNSGGGVSDLTERTAELGTPFAANQRTGPSSSCAANNVCQTAVLRCLRPEAQPISPRPASSMA